MGKKGEEGHKEEMCGRMPNIKCCGRAHGQIRENRGTRAEAAGGGIMLLSEAYPQTDLPSYSAPPGSCVEAHFEASIPGQG
jgi:hypothetical protein